MTDNDNTPTLTLRPLPTSPWIEQYPAVGRSLIDLRGLLLQGDQIERVTLNGRDIEHRIAPDHPHLFSVPLVPLEAGRLGIFLTGPARPLEASPRPSEGVPEGKVAHRVSEAPTYGLSPAERPRSNP